MDNEALQELIDNPGSRKFWIVLWGYPDNALNPREQVNIGRLQHGLHVRIPEAFAKFLLNEIADPH